MMKTSFVFYQDWYGMVKALPVETRVNVYDAICEYAFSGQEPDDPTINALTYIARQAIERDNERYEKTSSARKEAGKSGGNAKARRAKLKQLLANATDCQVVLANAEDAKQTLAKSSYNDNDNDIHSSYEEVDKKTRTRVETTTATSFSIKSLEDIRQELLKNESWRENFILGARRDMPDFSSEQLDKSIEDFISGLKMQGETHKTVGDAMRHFTHWWRKQLFAVKPVAVVPDYHNQIVSENVYEDF